MFTSPCIMVLTFYAIPSQLRNWQSVGALHTMHLPRLALQVTSQAQCCLSCCSNFKSWRVRFTWYHVALCKATLHHWPRDLPGHAVSFCRNMWEFSLSRCNNKGRSPPAVDCSTDGYLWRELMVRRARPLIATFASQKWLPVVSPYIYSNLRLSSTFFCHGMCQATLGPGVQTGKC